MTIKMGDIYFAKLQTNTPAQNGLQCGVRPVVIVSNNKGNKFSPTVIVVPLTSKIKKQHMSPHYIVKANIKNGLQRDSVALGEQITTIPKTDLLQKVGELNSFEIGCVRLAVMFATGDDELLECQYEVSQGADISLLKTCMSAMCNCQQSA